MGCGCDDVARRFAAQLYDVFSQVRFDGFYSVGFQIVVDGDLLANHGFAFGHGLGIGLAADFQDGFPCMVRVPAPMDLAALGLALGLELFQVDIQVCEDVVLDVPRLVPEGLKLGHARRRCRARGHKARVEPFEGFLQVSVR